MKRVKTVEAQNYDIKAKIKIEVTSESLVRWESDALIVGLADDAMRSLANAKYIHAPLSGIKVK